MPCDTIQRVQVDIGKLDPDHANAAITALGLQGTVTYANGRLTVRGGANVADITQQVKQAYSAEVVKSQAKRFGWGLKEIAPYKYEVTKR